MTFDLKKRATDHAESAELIEVRQDPACREEGRDSDRRHLATAAGRHLEILVEAVAGLAVGHVASPAKEFVASEGVAGDEEVKDEDGDGEEACAYEENPFAAGIEVGFAYQEALTLDHLA